MLCEEVECRFTEKSLSLFSGLHISYLCDAGVRTMKGLSLYADAGRMLKKMEITEDGMGKK